MHDDLAGARVMPANGDVLGGQRDDLAAYSDLAVVVGHHFDAVTGLAAVRIAGIGQFGGLRRRAGRDVECLGGGHFAGAGHGR